MYINDLPDVCKHFANVYLFADDAKLYNMYYVTMTTSLSNVA